jgi:hypothetical protein
MEILDSPVVKWKINSIRSLRKPEAIKIWGSNSEYQKFCLKEEAKKNGDKFKALSEEEKMARYATALKESLPPLIFGARDFDELPMKKDPTKKMKRRVLKGIHLSGLFMFDVDHVDNPREIFEKTQVAGFPWEIVMANNTSSGRGLRLVAKARPEIGNIADNQIELAKALGVKADASCVDASRISYAPSIEDVYYLNEEELINYYNEEFDKKYCEAYRNGRTEPTNPQHSFDDGGSETGTGGAEKAGEKSHEDLSKVTWRGYDIQSIIDQRYADKLPCKEDSNRHAESLKLATDLMLMLDGDKALVRQVVEAQPWVQEIIDERDENVEQTVESAAGCIAEKEKKYASSLPSKAMQEAVVKATGRTYQEVLKGVGPSASSGTVVAGSGTDCQLSNLNCQLEIWGKEIEGLFEDFPMLKDICDGLKRSQYPAAMFVGGGAMMTLMTRCWYRFYHRPQRERRLNCALMVIGHPASNKSMADDICDVLIEPIEEADKEGKAALNRYKKDTKKKAANKEGKDKPQSIIRIHPARTSNGQLIEDMLNAKEIVDGKEMQLHMFTFDTELDNSITLQSGGSWINKQAMELKAFHNEKDGQMYQNSDSPVDEFHVTWNYIYTGTPIALQKKVNEKNFGSGLSTRLAVIPMPKTNYEMIEFEDKAYIDWKRIERMKEWAYKLDKRAGELPFWPLVKHLYDWTKNRMEDCAEDDSEANELMLKRVPYHALNYAAPFIDMRHWENMHKQGAYWEGSYEVDEKDWKLCELIARIQYATQQHFFGVMAEKYFDDMNNHVQISGKRHQRRSVNGYAQLPEVFTQEDVKRSFGYSSENSIYSKIRRLIQNHSIEKIQEGDDAGKYRKVNQLLY